MPLSRLRVVVGSAFGELTTLVEMLEERERDGLLSPLRFQNSVHNSAAGQLSIAHKNKAPAMSLAAGNDTVAMVLLEAMTLLALGGDEVLAIVADEPLPQAIRPGHRDRAGRGRARAGGRTPAARGLARPPPLAVLEDLRQTPAAPACADRPLEVDSPCAAILPLIAALGHGRSGRVNVSPAEDPRWSIVVRDARWSHGERVTTTYPPIVELVPHRPPMLLLDRVLSYDGECVVCETVLGPDSPFVEQGHVPAVVGIEYMAQTIAAGAGLSARDKGSASARNGLPARVPRA